MKEDDEVESFFKKMKEADEGLAVPVFREQTGPERRRYKPAFLYAAATLAVVVAIVLWVQENRNQADELLILTGDDTMEINWLIEEESMSEWDSPTKFLAEDF